MSERTRWERFADNLLATIKILGLLAILVVSGKLFYDFYLSKEKLKLRFRGVKQKRWEKAADDPKKPTLDDPLTDKEIDDELEMLR